ncbi:hypothetical protein CZ787_13330 [Halomonas citrativorans]|uniref:Uncharacterized protein n=1 Tax=Halomonas citrativorans TaxID=2742612 RepID=A0A1R4I2X8_9GAMM|nr:hypothetical protein CZ787_13330 [Halomonas citrativorans]
MRKKTPLPKGNGVFLFVGYLAQIASNLMALYTDAMFITF